MWWHGRPRNLKRSGWTMNSTQPQCSRYHARLGNRARAMRLPAERNRAAHRVGQCLDSVKVGEGLERQSAGAQTCRTTNMTKDRRSRLASLPNSLTNELRGRATAREITRVTRNRV